LLSIFSSFKTLALPALKVVGSYLTTNKDQILKPLLGAVGTLGAKSLTEDIPALINKIASRNRHTPEIDSKIMEDPKYKEILQNIQTPSPIPVSNIIGSGFRNKKKGSGL